MGWFSDFLQGIPVNAALREQLKLAEQRFKDMEDENARLKEQVASLTAENEDLKRQVQQAPVAAIPQKESFEVMYGCYYFNNDSSKLYCPRCYETQGKKHVMADCHHLFYKCTVCGNTIHR
jgi:hypothetical protein